MSNQQAAFSAMESVLRERHNQILTGYTADHDDAHDKGELADLAYMLFRAELSGTPTVATWVKDAADKLHDDVCNRLNRVVANGGVCLAHRELCVKAAALLLAEIERIDRIQVDPLKWNVDDLPNISVRARQMLRKQLGVTKVADLVRLTRHDLESAKNCGEVTIKEIELRLSDHGLSLRAF